MPKQVYVAALPHPDARAFILAHEIEELYRRHEETGEYLYETDGVTHKVAKIGGMVSVAAEGDYAGEGLPKGVAATLAAKEAIEKQEEFRNALDEKLGLKVAGKRGSKGGAVNLNTLVLNHTVEPEDEDE
jgi:hypothetical protein